jgi:hypothetical protein
MSAFAVVNLFDGVVVMVGVDAKSCGLPLHPALRILEPTRWFGMLAEQFRTDEEIVWAVANARHTD